MKRIKILIFFVLFVYTSAGANDFGSIIDNYEKGYYLRAAYLLEKIRDKDAKIYFFLGQTYFKLNKPEKARKNFLAAYYLSPASKWGKAAYENYRYFIKKSLFFSLDLSMAYDSNVSFLPDIWGEKPGAFYADIYLSSEWFPADFASIKYSYSRYQYFSGIISNDSHYVAVGFYPGAASIKALSRYSAMGGTPFYFRYGGMFKTDFVEGRGEVKEYINAEYNYLDGFEASVKLKAGPPFLEISYEYTFSEAHDRKDKFTYQKATGTIYGGEYDFSEVESSKEYYLSYSYQEHRAALENRMMLSGDAAINMEGYYALKVFAGENKWFRDYWLEDTSASTWYYWDDRQGAWAESPEPAPGEPQYKSRIDNQVGGKLSLDFLAEKNTKIRVFLEYTLNISNMNDVATFNYNWSRFLGGCGVSYSF